MSCPSIKTLKTRLGVDEATARTLLDLMRGDADPAEFCGRWIAQCHNMPSDNELIMAAIDSVLGTFGVEAIRGRHVDNYHYDIQACYCNAGDTYDATILMDNETGNFHATSWGDWFEANERRRELA